MAYAAFFFDVVVSIFSSRFNASRSLGRCRCRHPCELPVRLLDKTHARRGVIGRRLGQRLGNDHAGSVDTEMELLPASLAASPVFRRGPFALADDRQARAVDDEMKRPPGRNAIENEIEALTPPRERGVIWRFEVWAHQDQDRPQEALGLAQGQPEDEPERQCGLDREVREFPRPARPTRRRRSPRVHRVVGEPECHVASPHEGSFVLWPVSDVIFRLVLRVHPRIHEEIVRQLPSTTPVDPRLHSGRSRADLHQRLEVSPRSCPGIVARTALATLRTQRRRARPQRDKHLH